MHCLSTFRRWYPAQVSVTCRRLRAQLFICSVSCLGWLLLNALKARSVRLLSLHEPFVPSAPSFVCIFKVPVRDPTWQVWQDVPGQLVELPRRACHPFHEAHIPAMFTHGWSVIMRCNSTRARMRVMSCKPKQYSSPRLASCHQASSAEAD